MPIVGTVVFFLRMNEGLLHDRESCQSTMNQWGNEQKDFFFFISYEMERNILLPLDRNCDNLFFDFPEQSKKLSEDLIPCLPEHIRFQATPPTKEEYKTAFSRVHKSLTKGETQLLNLTFPSAIDTNLNLEHFFSHAKAPFKVLVRQGPWGVTCFSPEIFVNIDHDVISTFPMKGTIPAKEKNAEALLINNPKEAEEHAFIVELMKKDLASVADNIVVKRFRYINRITTHKGDILQTSSEIIGTLPKDWRDHIGDILYSLLPAGSITGVPKKESCEVIRESETYERGFYTGVFGYCSGNTLRSAVAIRYIEQNGSSMTYKSGGGITAMSQCKYEYRELIDKVYAPFMVRNN